MDDVAKWLAELGLSVYAPRFSEHDIDFSILRDLSEQDLRDIGVASLGHRRKLMRALAELTGTASLHPSTPAPAQNSSEAAERRQLTVMFCDLVGSTAMSARSDPEDMREIIQVYQQVCARVVRAHDAFIARFMGDGVLVYFGYPRAHEDDAERAVRAGLDIVTAIEGLEAPGGVPLQVRVGIATGPVVVGYIIGEGAAQERGVVGETPNVAAHLQGLAEPGTVVIADSTRRLLGSLFRLRDLGRRRVKGYPEPMAVWAVEGAAAVETRFEATRSWHGVGFVGREEQMAVLLDRKEAAWRGQGQIVLISGEPGIGKSRLAAWLADTVAAEAHIRMRYQCSASHTNSALYPFIQHLKWAAALDPSDKPEQQLEKLESVIAMATPEVSSVAPLLAALLSIPAGDRYPPTNLSAALRRRQTLAALLGQFVGLARRQPVVLLFEDLQWADATSRELIDLAVERVPDLPILAIVTFRSDFAAPWGDRPNVTALTLDRLDAAHVRRMVQRLCGHRELPSEVVEQIIAKTDGVPLFVEELTKAVLESGLLVADADAYRLDGPLPALAIPATLQDSLTARLDHLDSVQEVAQVGAAIGRSFSSRMVACVVGRDDASVKVALDKLAAAQLVFKRGTPYDAVYTFKHALVQDAAYETLLRSRRPLLHARIARAIEEHFPDLVETESEVLAQHCARAGLAEKAVTYWLKAGRQSQQRSNLAEAITHFQSAITLLASEPDSIENRRQELACQTALAQALIGAKGYGAPQTMEAWQRARVLAATAGNAAQRFAANYGLWVGQYAQGHVPASLALASESLKEAQAAGDPTQLCITHRMNAVAHFATGDFIRARDHGSRAVEFYDEKLHPKLANELGHDLLVAALCFKALALWPLGFPDQARDTIFAALAHAKRLEHAASLAYTYWHAGVIGIMMLGDDALLAEHAEALVTVARKHGLYLWECGGRVVQGWLNARQGEGETAVNEIRSAFDAMRHTGTHVNDTVVLGLLGEAQAAAGDVAGGLSSIAQGIGLAETSGQRFWLAELYRKQGLLQIRSGSEARARAEVALRKAVETARLQEAVSWELRAAVDLASLLAEDGRAAEGVALLAGVHGSFREGFDTVDLRAAASLIEDLRGRSRRRRPLHR